MSLLWTRSRLSMFSPTYVRISYTGYREVTSNLGKFCTCPQPAHTIVQPCSPDVNARPQCYSDDVPVEGVISDSEDGVAHLNGAYDVSNDPSLARDAQASDEPAPNSLEITIPLRRCNRSNKGVPLLCCGYAWFRIYMSWFPSPFSEVVGCCDLNRRDLCYPTPSAVTCPECLRWYPHLIQACLFVLWSSTLNSLGSAGVTGLSTRSYVAFHVLWLIFCNLLFCLYLSNNTVQTLINVKVVGC